MKYCANCGNDVSGKKFCDKCGQQNKGMEGYVNQASPVQQQVYQAQPTRQIARKKLQMMIVIVAGIIAVISLVGALSSSSNIIGKYQDNYGYYIMDIKSNGTATQYWYSNGTVDEELTYKKSDGKNDSEEANYPSGTKVYDFYEVDGEFAGTAIFDKEGKGFTYKRPAWLGLTNKTTWARLDHEPVFGNLEEEKSAEDGLEAEVWP